MTPWFPNIFQRRPHRLWLAVGVPCLVAVVIAGALRLDAPATARQTGDYPKLANYFLKTPITDAEATELAKWDVVILGMQAQTVCPEQVKKIKQLNPKVKILAYVLSADFPRYTYERVDTPTGLWHQMLAEIPDGWYLLKPDGSHFSTWPGHWTMNVTNSAPVDAQGRRWNTFLPQFMHDRVMSTGLWDGIYYDNVWDSASWIMGGDMDINRDGVRDEASWLNGQWNEGMRTMLARSRQLEGPDAIIIGNGSNDFKESMNGRLIEDAYWQSWLYDQRNYVDYMARGREPRVTVVSSNTHNTGRQDDYRTMRFGLTSALMDNGYYSFDWGTEDHSQLWWYDEYNADIGAPLSAAYPVDGGSSEVRVAVWRRDFERGTVFLNATDEVQTLVFREGEEFEKLNGTQERNINDGSKVNYLRLPARDGIVVFRPLSEIVGTPFPNGAFARVFGLDGSRRRGGFYAYQRRYPGGSRVAIVDLDGDGERETVVAGASAVEIFNSSGTRRALFYPYTDKFRSGITIAVGDLDGDGQSEIVTGTLLGGGPHVRTFNRDGRLLNPGFFAYDKNYRGGVSVAICRFGDGYGQIVTGAGKGGGPQIRIFARDGKLLSGGWFAENGAFRGGLNVACGDLTGDGRDEIVSAPAAGAAPNVSIWDNRGRRLGGPFLAFDAANRSGVAVAVADLDGDGIGDIAALSYDVF